MGKIKRLFLYHSRWLLPLSLLAFIFALFTQLLDMLDQQSNPNITRHELINKGHLLELNDWNFNFQNCDYAVKPMRCSYLSLEPQPIRLPNLTRTSTLLSSNFPEANVAIAERNFSDAELAWLENFRGKALSFLIPNSFQSAVFLYVGKKEHWAQGSAIHVHFTVAADQLIQHKSLRLEFEFDRLQPFGPADLAPAIATPQTSVDYFALRERQVGIGNLVKQIYIGFPLLIAAIALVLDHSRAIILLAAVGAAQSARSFIAFLVDSGATPYKDLELYNLAVNGLGAAFLILLAFELAEIRSVSRTKKAILVSVALFSSLLLSLFGESFLLKTDSVIDAFSAAVCLFIIFFGFIKISARFKNTSRNQNDQEGLQSSLPLLFLRLTVASIGFGISFLANLQDLQHIQTESFKSVLDWKHLILFPSLISAALLEVGSTSKKMFSFAKQLVSKALIEKELAVGKEVQLRMLPERKATQGYWSWRSVYIPATALAGDWYDIREILFGNGKSLLVACIADVTGHGVGAALATSVISSHWGLWCENLSRMEFPSDTETKDSLIIKAPEQINKGLLALRNNENCTAIFCMLDAYSQTVSICCAGHPGALLSDGKTLKYLKTSGDRLGGQELEQQWESQTSTILATEFLILYSDGIIPVGKTVSSWTSQLKREIRKDNQKALKEILVSQIKENRREFRRSKDVEDDMTLVAISFNTQVGAEKPRAA